MVARVVALLLVSLPVSSSVIATGRSVVKVDGRDVVVHNPGGSSPLPLVVALHGWGGSATSGGSICDTGDIQGHSQSLGFIGVCPSGTHDQCWNAAGCCGQCVTKNVDDVTFIRDVVAYMKKEASITKVYATGLSNGAMMTWRLACEANDIFDGAAPFSGGWYGEPSFNVSKSHPVPFGWVSSKFVCSSTSSETVKYSKLSGHGKCSDIGYEVVSDQDECEMAASQLGLSDTSAGKTGASFRSNDPPGCYWEASGQFKGLWFNPNSASSADGHVDNDYSICKSGAPSPPPSGSVPCSSCYDHAKHSGDTVCWKPKTYPCTAPSNFPIMYTHGEADDNEPYALVVADFKHFAEDVLHCKGLATEPNYVEGKAKCFEYASCPLGRRVAFCSVKGMVHQLPGKKQGFDGVKAAWKWWHGGWPSQQGGNLEVV